MPFACPSSLPPPPGGGFTAPLLENLHCPQLCDPGLRSGEPGRWPSSRTSLPRSGQPRSDHRPRCLLDAIQPPDWGIADKLRLSFQSLFWFVYEIHEVYFSFAQCCHGARVQEGFGELLSHNTLYSGTFPEPV